MKYYVEESLADFKAWAGGRYTLDTLGEGDVDSVEVLIEEVFCDETPSQTEINDFLWFERDMIAQHLGFSNWEEYECGENGEEEE